MNNDWKEWFDRQMHLISTPVGAGVGIGSFVVGILIGKLILDALKGF